LLAAATAVVGHVATRAAVPATPAAVQRKAVRLPVEAVLAVSLKRRLGRLGRRLTAGYERRQAGIAATFDACLRHVGLRPATAVGLRLTRLIRRLLALIRVGFARRIRLLIPAAVRHVAHRMARRLVIAPVETLVALFRVVAEVRIALPELFLRGGDQAEVMLGVLKVVLRRHRVARGLRVARQLHVFLGDVVGSPADFHVGTVGFVDPRERILALAVSPPHAFVLTVSHGFWFVFSVVRRPSRRFSPRPTRRAI
jgi:hypothetical protein